MSKIKIYILLFLISELITCTSHALHMRFTCASHALVNIGAIQHLRGLNSLIQERKVPDIAVVAILVPYLDDMKTLLGADAYSYNLIF